MQMQATHEVHDGGAAEIELAQVEKWYGTRDEPVHALSSTDLKVAHGEMLVLLGPSGCGKTTMLRMIGGLVEPSSGEIRIAGRNLWANGKRQDEAVQELGIVFQDANLFPWLTIEQNIALPLEMRGVDAAKRTARAKELMDLVGISGFGRRWAARAVRRHASTRSHCTRAFLRPRNSFDGRAIRRVRCDDARRHEHRASTHLAGNEKNRRAGDPLDFPKRCSSPIASSCCRRVRGRIDTVIEVDLPRPRTLGMQSES